MDKIFKQLSKPFYRSNILLLKIVDNLIVYSSHSYSCIVQILVYIFVNILYSLNYIINLYINIRLELL